MDVSGILGQLGRIAAGCFTQKSAYVRFFNRLLLEFRKNDFLADLHENEVSLSIGGEIPLRIPVQVSISFEKKRGWGEKGETFTSGVFFREGYCYWLVSLNKNLRMLTAQRRHSFFESPRKIAKRLQEDAVCLSNGVIAELKKRDEDAIPGRYNPMEEEGETVNELH